MTYYITLFCRTRHGVRRASRRIASYVLRARALPGGGLRRPPTLSIIISYTSY